MCTLGIGLTATAQKREATVVTIDAPGAGTSPFYGTIANAINPGGAIVAYDLDSANIFHSFLRAPDGTFTKIDAPGAGTGAFEATIAYSINPAGAITGNYADASNVSHGFLRAPDGTFVTFDAPGAA